VKLIFKKQMSFESYRVYAYIDIPA